MLSGTSRQGRGGLVSIAATAAASVREVPTRTSRRGRNGIVPWSLVVLASLVGNTEAFVTGGVPPVGTAAIGR